MGGDARAGGRPRARVRRIYAAHDRWLHEAGTLDFGDLVLDAFRLLRTTPARARPRVRALPPRAGRRAAGRELRPGPAAALAGKRQRPDQRRRRRRPGDPPPARRGGQEPARLRGRVAAGDGGPARGEPPLPGARSWPPPARSPSPRPTGSRRSCGGKTPAARSRSGSAASERAQAQAVAAEIERLVAREDVAPEDICVLVRSIRNEGQAVAVALEERAVPHRLAGAAAFFQRAEVRDLLAWLRLLVDPGDAGAVVRALARPPVELRAIDIARCTQIARRRKLDMVAALGAALESPQIPPEARERIRTFFKLYRAASAALDSARPDLYVHRLIERLGLRRQLLFAASVEVVERLRQPRQVRRARRRLRAPRAAGHRARVRPLDRRGRRGRACARRRRWPATRPGRRAGDGDARGQGARVRPRLRARPDGRAHARAAPAHARADPGRAAQGGAARATPRRAHIAEMRRLLHVAMTRARKRLVLAYPETTERGAAQTPVAVRGGGARRGRRRVGAATQEELFGPAETLQSTFRLLRDELLTTVSQVGGRLGELRFDTDLDVSHAVVRYLELIKLAALLERTERRGHGGRRRAAGGQRAAAAGGDRRAARDLRDAARSTSTCSTPSATSGCARAPWPRAPSRRSSPSSPSRGDGLMLSASDIETYRTCPLKYKFARVFRIPSEPTIEPALRDPRPPGARALPRRRGRARARCRSCSGCSRRAGGAAASATPRRSASCARRPPTR